MFGKKKKVRMVGDSWAVYTYSTTTPIKRRSVLAALKRAVNRTSMLDGSYGTG